MNLSVETYKHQMSLLEECFNVPPGVRRVRAWWQVLRHCTDDELAAGVAGIIATRTRFPTLADLMAAIRAAKAARPGLAPGPAAHRCPVCGGTGRLTVGLLHPEPREACAACDCEAGKPFAAVLSTVSELSGNRGVSS